MSHSESLHASPSAGIPATGFPTRKAAVIAGVGYVLLFVLAIFANFFVREGLIVAGDAVATAINISGSEGLFRAGMVSFLAVFLLDVVVAWALFVVFRVVDHDLSLLAAWFRLVYTVFLGVALLFFFQGLQYLGGAEFLAAFDESQLGASALVSFDAFNTTWLIGLSAFGIHLVILGYLILTTRMAPRLLGFFLLISGIAYVIDTAAHAVLSNYATYASVFVAVVAIPSVIAEGWFGIWLLVKGGKD